MFEGNGFDDFGVFSQTLSAGTASPSGTGSTIFTANQPDPQSVGDLDYDNNEIIYYFDGFIHRYSRTNNGFLGQYLITGLPVPKADINSNSVVYTGSPGNEIGIYDFTNQQLLFINKVTGAYSGSCQLPATAPQRSSFGVSYANKRLWIFDQGFWTGYQVVSTATGVDAAFGAELNLYPNPVQDKLSLSASRPANHTVSCMNLHSQVLFEQSFAPSEEMVLDFSSLPAGAYLLRITDGTAFAMKKVLKQ